MRLFLGAPVPGAASRAIATAAARAGMDGARLVDPADYHVTVEFYGEVPDGPALHALERGIEAALASVTGFGVTTGTAGRFPGVNAVWVGFAEGAGGFGGLLEAVEGSTAGVGSTSPKRARQTPADLVPHLTVARVGPDDAARAAAVRCLAAVLVPTRWDVASLVLYESRPGQRHLMVRRFPLGAVRDP